MVLYEFFLTSSLEKVLPHIRPAALENGTLSCWRGQKCAVQLVYTVHGGYPNMPVQQYRIQLIGVPGKAQLRHVQLMNANLACYENSDADYISKFPGLYPDLLTEAKDCEVLPLPRQYRSLWVTFRIPEDATPGDYTITLRCLPCCHKRQPDGTVFHDSNAEGQIFDLPLTLKVGKASLPPQQLLHTEWFHTDCIADYYGLEVFTGEYWHITERFIASAAEHGINMLLTPIFTPPLDTPVGRERTTVQLVDITARNGRYHFDFFNLGRWVRLCRKHGITHLEMPHLFTQWGAAATPKIMATVNGEKKQIFGWEIPAGSPEYRNFLEQFLPVLIRELESLGFDKDHVYFHISDEPSPEHADAFHTALKQTEGLLDGCHVFDALTNFEFYRQGLIQTPVVANDHIQPFYDAGISDLWVYYCCVQGDKVPNRFFAMPSRRNRIMGLLMYLYDVAGFLHWGFNFYNAKYSIHRIDPFRCADGDCGYPAGDPFLVYPGPDGIPLSSVRAEVQDDALLDLRALRLLEALAGRDFVTKLILNTARMEEITFTDYPRTNDFLLTLRERVAAEIENRL